jgi:hypothetical protein
MADALQALFIVTAAIELVGAFISEHYCYEATEYALDLLFQLLNELTAELADTGDDDLCLQAFKTVVEVGSSSIDLGHFSEFDLIAACVPMTTNGAVRHVFDKLIDQLSKNYEDQDEGYRYDNHYPRLQYQSMRLNLDPRAEEYAQERINDGFFLKVAVSKAFLSGNFGRVKELLHSEYGQEMGAWRMKYTSMLPYGSFPHGWLTVIEAVFEAEQDTEALLNLYQVYAVKAGSQDYVQRIKSLSPDNWPERLAELVEAFKQDGHPSEAFEALMRKESLVDKALDYISAHPSRAPSLCRLTAERYPAETRSIFKELIDKMSKPPSGRKAYQDVCAVIQRYQSAFGTDDAMLIVDDLLARYKQRPAMRQELTRLAESWVR